MKKINFLISIFLISLFVLPINTLALENNFVTEIGENVNSNVDVDGSNIIAGNNVSFEHSVNGINTVFGSTVNMKGNSEYALILGATINLSGNVQKDALIVGSIITMDSEFNANRDIFIFGENVLLKGKITRDVKIYASSVILENVEIGNNVDIKAEKIEIKDNTVINGKLLYNNDAEIIKSEKTTINSIELSQPIYEKQSFIDILWENIITYGGNLLVFLVLSFLIPNLFTRLGNKAINIKPIDLLSSFGLGAMSLVAIPMIFIILMTFVFGVPLAILLIIFYGVLIYLSSLIFGYLIGTIILKKVLKKEDNILFSGLIGITLITLLQMIPYINTVITMISMFIGIGLIISLLKKEKDLA